MIWEDRELLAELARLNTAMTPLAMRIMDGSVTITEQRDYARRLITAGEWLQRRAGRMDAVVIEGEVLINDVLALPGHTVARHQES